MFQRLKSSSSVRFCLIRLGPDYSAWIDTSGTSARLFSPRSNHRPPPSPVIPTQRPETVLTLSPSSPPPPPAVFTCLDASICLRLPALMKAAGRRERPA